MTTQLEALTIQTLKAAVTSSAELFFLVQWFVVSVEQHLTDWGLRVPLLTPVDE
jgi:hypothetical protein